MSGKKTITPGGARDAYHAPPRFQGRRGQGRRGGETCVPPARSEGPSSMPHALASKRFRILRRLGEGGMGVVYEAEDRERGGKVALKTLRQTSPEHLARLKREFRVMQEVHHANLVT